ncbi:MAG TPA: type II secretion system F family protein, partial [Candidatus Baltobacteraceae bacterium]|nr:type II secretion system F family protein [Candidatus Baltobacteraceae bacterium]
MRFKYSATTAQGRIENGTIDARSSAEAAEQIRSTGMLVVSLRRDAGGSFVNLLGIGWVPNVMKVTFAKHMSLMIKAGLPIDEAVRVLAEQATGRFRKALMGVLAAVEGGRQLSEGFAQYPRIFSELFIATIRAGESSGTLERSLDDLAIQLAKSYDLQRKIRGAMIYPVLVLTAAAGIGMGLSLFVLPRIIGLFDSITVELPLATRLMIGFSKFMVAYGVPFTIGVVAAIFGIYQLLGWKPVRPFSHGLLLRMPIFGTLARNFNLAMFARTMATLLKSGITIGDAFEITSNTLRNARYKKALLRVQQGTETGVPASTVLEEFPRLFPS